MSQTARIDHLMNLANAMIRELKQLREQTLEVRDIPSAPGYRARADGKIIGKRGTFLKPWHAGSYEAGQYHERHESDGRERVAIFVGGNKPLRRNVHALIAEAFLGPRPEGNVIHHINGDFRDNRPENLEYMTHEQHAALHTMRRRHRWAA